jgi:large subunit ribosomal protein L31
VAPPERGRIALEALRADGQALSFSNRSMSPRVPVARLGEPGNAAVALPVTLGEPPGSRLPGDPGDHQRRIMKPDIHPEYVETTVTCSCGNTFTTRSTAKNGVIHADVCNQCHPFYTGKQKILDTGGRVAKFEKRFGKQSK